MSRINGYTDISAFLDTNIRTAKEVNSTINLSQIRKDIKTNNLEYKTSDKELNVFFSLDNKSVGVSLDDEILKDLKSFFNKSDFLEENGKIILKGDVANYVAGWFSEIAFDLNYLKSDTNNDGVLNKDELLNTYTSGLCFHQKENGMYVLDEIIYKEQTSEDYINQAGDKNINTISKMLNGTIYFDKNKDKNISIKEIYIDDEEEYLKELNNAKEDLKEKNKKEKIEVDPKIKEYVINERNSYIRRLKHDIKVLKNAKSLKIDKKKEKELKEQNNLDDFCEFSLKLIDNFKAAKLLDIKA